MGNNSPRIVKQGTWRYANEVVCDVRITVVDLRPGTYDYEDDPEQREDKIGTFFKIEYGGPGERGRYRSEGGYFETLSSAVRHVEEATHGTLEWNFETE